MRSSRFLVFLAIAVAIGSVLALPAAASIAGDDTPVLLTPKGEHETGADEQSFDKLRDAYYATRLLSGDQPLSLTQAAALRNSAGNQAAALKAAAPVVGGAWNTAGPSPIVQNGRTDAGMPKFSFTKEQVADIAAFLHTFRAAGYDKGTSEQYVRTLRSRINELNRLHDEQLASRARKVR